MHKSTFLLGALFFLLIGCSGNESPKPTVTPSLENVDETRVNNVSSNAFSLHVANLKDLKKIRRFNIGDDFFENPWVEKTASTSLRDGLGPLFNNDACQDCHIRDGRGGLPSEVAEGETQFFNSVIIKAIKTDISPDKRTQMLSGTLGNVGDTSVGPQLQQHAIFDIQKESGMRVSYEYSNVVFNDGAIVEIRKPIWQLQSLYEKSGYDFNADTIFSARAAQPMIGLGLLGLIDESDILALADPEDTNEDGISGKANMVWDVMQNRTTLGRYGWKAGQPSVRQQAAGAFNNDMGLTSAIFPNDGCLAHQADCLSSPKGDGDSQAEYPYEVSETVLDAIEFYAKHLAVPQRRAPNNADVVQGREIFMQSGCNTCHVESYTTQYSEAFPELSEQPIEPYTDMLLHDMGEGLADFTLANQAASDQHLVEYQAHAREWRTPPLWGLGLTLTVNPEAGFLHDGRARTILEAVVWHGGEAESAKQAVLALSAQERAHLLAFLNDL